MKLKWLKKSLVLDWVIKLLGYAYLVFFYAIVYSFLSMTLLVSSTLYVYSQLTEKDRLQTEILAAIKFHRIDQVKHLSVAYLNIGGDIDFRNDDGSTPLMLAACEGFLEAVVFFISMKASLTRTNRIGYTVAHYAAYSKNKELIDFLQTKGADFAQLSVHGCTPQLTARQINNHDIQKYLKEANGLAQAYSKELLSRKRLAHILAIKGTTTLPHPSMKRFVWVTQALEGWHASDFWYTLAKRTKAFFATKAPDTLPAGINPELIVELCMLASNNKPHDQLKRYREDKKPIAINFGYNEHHSVIVLWGNFAVICERGGFFNNGFLAVQIDPQKIDSDFIHKITSVKSGDKYNYVQQVLKVFDTCLAPQQHALFSNLNVVMQLPKQTTGNCSWANSEAALYAFFVLQSIQHSAKSQMTIGEICTRQKELFDEFRDFVIRYDADKYLSRHLDKQPKSRPYYTSEADFLRRMKPNLPKDLACKVDTLLSHIR